MRYFLTLLFYIGLTIPNANAATVFFDNDLVGFNLASTTALTDFEGFVADNTSTSAPSYTIDGNTYSSSGGLMVICGKDGCTGSPFDSAAMVAAGSGMATVRIDLDGGISAIGGLFGDLDGPTGEGTLSVFDSGGLFDSQVVNYGDMGEGLPKTFFGWTTTDTLFTALEFSIAQNRLWSAVDNIQFGRAENISAIPVPAAVWLFGTALTGFLGMSRKRKLA